MNHGEGVGGSPLSDVWAVYWHTLHCCSCHSQDYKLPHPKKNISLYKLTSGYVAVNNSRLGPTIISKTFDKSLSDRPAIQVCRIVQIHMYFMVFFYNRTGLVTSTDMMGFYLRYVYGNFKEVAIYPWISSKLHCASVCSIETKYHACTTYKFDENLATCQCGKLWPFLLEPYAETRIHVGMNCEHNISGKTCFQKGNDT